MALGPLVPSTWLFTTVQSPPFAYRAPPLATELDSTKTVERISVRALEKIAPPRLAWVVQNRLCSTVREPNAA